MNAQVLEKTEIDEVLARLIQASPSINAMPQEKSESIVLAIFMLPEDKKYELRDLLLAEQKDLAQASAQQMHVRYEKLKGIYETLLNMKKHAKADVLKFEEAKDREAEDASLQLLDDQIEDAI